MIGTNRIMVWYCQGSIEDSWYTPFPAQAVSGDRQRQPRPQEYILESNDDQ